MSIQSLTPMPAPPLPTDAEAVFDAHAGASLTAQVTFTNEMNTGVIPGINAAVLDVTNKAESATSSANAAAGSVTAANTSKNAAESAAQTAQIAAAASGASAGIGHLGNPGDSLQVNPARTGLVFGPSDGKVGDVLISARTPGSLFVPANGGIRAQSALPSLLGVLGLLGGQVGQQYATLSAGTTTTVVDVASAPNPNGGAPLVMQVCADKTVNFSSDGGGSWVTKNVVNITSPVSISYDEASGLWLVAYSLTDRISYSSDNGVTWSVTPAGGGLPAGLSKIVADVNGVWIATGAAASTSIYRSPDKGTTWTAITTGVSAVHTAISTDNKGVWCVIAGSTVRRSINGGVSWVVQLTASGTLNAISNDRNGVWLISGLTSNSNTYKSVDNGLTFTLLATPVTSTVTDIAYSQGFFFLVRNVSPQLIMISSAADATTYTVPATAVLASLIKVTATAGYAVAVNSANTTVLRSAPLFSYDQNSQLQLPNFPVANGLQAWIKAGLVMLSSGKAFTSASSVGTSSITGIDTDGTGVVIVIDMATIRRSADFGVTWSTITSPSPATSTQYVATNRRGLWLIGCAGGVLFRSVDNGLTFSLVTSANHGFVTTIAQIVIGKDDVMIGCEVGNGRPRRSTDGGLNWAAVSAGTAVGGISKAATDGLGKWVFAHSANKTLYASSDNGATFPGVVGFTLTASISDVVMTLDGKVLISSTTSTSGTLFLDYGNTLWGAFTLPGSNQLLKKGPGKSVLTFSSTGSVYVSPSLELFTTNWILSSTSPTSTATKAATSGDRSPFILIGTFGGVSTVYNGTLDILV